MTQVISNHSQVWPDVIYDVEFTIFVDSDEDCAITLGKNLLGSRLLDFLKKLKIYGQVENYSRHTDGTCYTFKPIKQLAKEVEFYFYFEPVCMLNELLFEGTLAKMSSLQEEANREEIKGFYDSNF